MPVTLDPTLYNYLNVVNGQPTEELRLQALNEALVAVPRIRFILIANFDPNVKFLLPEGKIPYRENQVRFDQAGGLMTAIRQLPYFLEDNGVNPYPALGMEKRLTMFTQLLESIDVDDAKLMVHLKDKNLTKLFKNLTKEFVSKVIPELRSE